jgi:hypothetical protein
VSEKVAKEKKLICNLVIDEMAIRRRIEWNGSKVTGFVDLGTDIQSDETPEAKEALVFMLVMLNDSWTLSIAYFLINGLCGPEKANLVLKLLDYVDSASVIISSITFDGATSNVSMATHLGADFSNPDSLKTWFEHPIHKYKIFLFLDACHMLKLIRNCLASQGIMTNATNELIAWDFFKKLVELQEAEGLHAATKIKKTHILGK